MYITLEKAKQHLNLEPEYTVDDDYIQGLIEVAEASVEVHVNEALKDIAERNGGELPSPLSQAMLLMIGNLYMNRETIAPSKVMALPYNYEYLIRLYQNWNN